MRRFHQFRQFNLAILCKAVLCCLLSLTSSAGIAGVLSLNPSGTGSIDWTDIVLVGSGSQLALTSTNPLQSLKYYPFSPVGELRTTSLGLGYLLFDVPVLPFVAQSATIRFDLSYARFAVPNLTVTGLELVDAQSLATIPTGTQRITSVDAFLGGPLVQAAFTRLGYGYQAIESGTPLGTLGGSGPLNGLYDLTLSSAAVDLINSSPGLMGLGLTWTPTVDIINIPGLGEIESGSDALVFNAAPILTVADATIPVPLPGTFALIVAGLLLLGQSRWQSLAPRSRTAFTITRRHCVHALTFESR
ncbi:MAG: hypothetical protein R3E64_03540 [Halioglobus sp.]